MMESIDIQQQLRARVEYLEEINRWHMLGIDLLASMQEIYSDAKRGRNPTVILANARQYLSRLIEWETIAFMRVHEEDASFELFDCYPEQHQSEIQRYLDDFIDSGEFAWAINQNREVILQPKGKSKPIVLHLLTTKTRIRGMFVGVPKNGIDSIPDGSLTLLSVILHHTAYALESAELYKLITDHNSTLEEAIAKRTAELQYQHTHDVLTGLPNRTVFHQYLDKAIAQAQTANHHVAVLLLDLDAFKWINDSMGHRLGDSLLVQLAERFRQLVQTLDPKLQEAIGDVHIARFGGDEFCFMLSRADSNENVQGFAQRLLEVIATPLKLLDFETYITASIGVSLFPHDGTNHETLITNADVAMYHAKANGKNAYKFFTSKMNARAQRHMALNNDLHRAMENKEFVLYYQPQVQVDNGRTSGMEALIRWQKPDGTLVPPAQFVHFLEEDSSLMIPVGEWILDEACGMATRVKQKGFRGIRMSVNLSAQQFKQKNLVEFIQTTLQRHQLAPGNIELEITESAIMHDISRAIRLLSSLRELGVHIAIDDFGTGYSSLSHLKQFPLDTLKIDRSFVQGIPHDAGDVAIVTATVTLAHALKMEIVAEGIENEAQLRFMRNLKCEYLQGYYFSKPVSEASLFEFLMGKRA
jgi:diguanylate cyclase